MVIFKPEDNNNSDIIDNVTTHNISFNNVQEPINMYIDSEYTTINKIIVDSIQVLVPDFSDNVLIALKKDGDIKEKFNPFIEALKFLTNYNIEYISDNTASNWVTRLTNTAESLCKDGTSYGRRKKIITMAIKDGKFDKLLEEFSFSRTQLSFKKGQVSIKLPVKKIDIYAHFMQADLFKIFGKVWHTQLFNSPLVQKRTLGFRHNHYQHLCEIMIDGQVFEIQFNLKDTMHRFPPKKGKSLGAQCDVLKAKQFKVEDSSIDKSNMTKMFENNYDNVIKYSAVDPIATHALDQKQKELFQELYKDFKLPFRSDISNTTGSNVVNFLTSLITKSFSKKRDIKEIKKTKEIITKLMKQGNIENLSSNVFTNQYGVQGFKTTGGLLYTRMAFSPSITGRFGDLDLESCYGTVLSNMNLYLGEPIVLSWSNEKDKWRLKDIVPLLDKFPDDAWYLRVSGKLSEAVNTLIYSDLTFKPENIPFKKDEANGNKIGAWTKDKNMKHNSESSLLTKEIQFGVINQHVLDMIKLLPATWQEEYMSLTVDFITGYPKKTLCNNIDELNKMVATLPDESTREELRNDLTMLYTTQPCKSNATLVFPLYKYVAQLKELRQQHKQNKNPIEQIYKVIINTIYGILSSVYFKTNNPIAANHITGTARCATWMMTNGLNGFQAITDGSTFSWEHIPTGETFHKLLNKNPNYLIEFDNSINSNLLQNEHTQDWVDNNFVTHINNFFQCQNSVINLFDFSLKEEEFESSEGLINTTLFTKFINSSSGDYIKAMHGRNHITGINPGRGRSYSFNNIYSQFKARGFKTKYDSVDESSFTHWYVNTLESDCYTHPYIYEEDGIYNLTDGNEKAIKYLERDEVNAIAHPMGTSNKTYSIPKLIRRSQFLFQTIKQLTNFEGQQYKLSQLSKEVLNNRFWKRLKLEDVSEFGITELIDTVDYHDFSKKHAVGVSFEILSFNKRNKGSIRIVREKIANYIKEGENDFNASLNLGRASEDHIERLKYILASVIIKRCNNEYYELKRLTNSVNEPTVLVVTKEDIRKING